MQYRTLGKTGLHVSAIGVGTWAWGGMWGPRNDRAATETLRAAVELGANFVDTALVYGDGHSERLIGAAMKRLGNYEIAVATKIPPKNFGWPAQSHTPLKDAFPAKWIVACTERSLKHLGVECLDLQQFHVWTDAWLQETEWRDAIDRLKMDGKIKHFGVSINDHASDSTLKLVQSGLVETIQVIYNLFDQTPAERLLPLCQHSNVGVIGRVPFDEGGLTGALTRTTTFHRSDWRRRYFAGEKLSQTVERAERLKTLLVRGETTTLAQAALRFVLSHPAVSTVIPGMRSAAHVGENLAVAGQPPYDGEMLRTLQQHAWPRNFYTGVW